MHFQRSVGLQDRSAWIGDHIKDNGGKNRLRSSCNDIEAVDMNAPLCVH
jgi:hypothetical protein